MCIFLNTDRKKNALFLPDLSVLQWCIIWWDLNMRLRAKEVMC